MHGYALFALHGIILRGMLRNLARAAASADLNHRQPKRTRANLLPTHPAARQHFTFPCFATNALEALEIGNRLVGL
jgi:hypothetical protein